MYISHRNKRPWDVIYMEGMSGLVLPVCFSLLCVALSGQSADLIRHQKDHCRPPVLSAMAYTIDPCKTYDHPRIEP